MGAMGEPIDVTDCGVCPAEITVQLDPDGSPWTAPGRGTLVWGWGNGGLPNQTFGAGGGGGGGGAEYAEQDTPGFDAGDVIGYQIGSDSNDGVTSFGSVLVANPGGNAPPPGDLTGQLGGYGGGGGTGSHTEDGDDGQAGTLGHGGDGGDAGGGGGSGGAGGDLTHSGGDGGEPGGGGGCTAADLDDGFHHGDAGRGQLWVRYVACS